MKIYTRTGDDGETGLFGGARVRKDDARVEAYGCLDELNAVLGVAIANELPDVLLAEIVSLQGQLFVLGAEVACKPGEVHRMNLELLDDANVVALEKLIDGHEESLPTLKTFILPAGSKAGTALHHARTVARRAERRCLCLTDLRPVLIKYINRLSDYLFVLARRANQLGGAQETPWLPTQKRHD
jgi:cob(I)alamin adenosyltransferase